MPTEKEILIIQKAAAYDLKLILQKEPERTYTVKEINDIIDAYIAGAESQASKD